MYVDQSLVLLYCDVCGRNCLTRVKTNLETGISFYVLMFLICK